MHRQAGGVAEQAPERNRGSVGKLGRWDGPGFQLTVDILIEEKLSFRHHLQGRHRRHGFRYRCRLEQRGPIDPFGPTRLEDTVAFTPVHAAVMHRGDAHPRHPVPLKQRGHDSRWQWLAEHDRKFFFSLSVRQAGTRPTQPDEAEPIGPLSATSHSSTLVTNGT